MSDYHTNRSKLPTSYLTDLVLHHAKFLENTKGLGLNAFASPFWLIRDQFPAHVSMPNAALWSKRSYRQNFVFQKWEAKVLFWFGLVFFFFFLKIALRKQQVKQYRCFRGNMGLQVPRGGLLSILHWYQRGVSQPVHLTQIQRAPR